MVLVVVVAIVVFGIHLLPRRIDTLNLERVSRYTDLLGYDLVTAQYLVKDQRVHSLEDVVKSLKIKEWDNKRDDKDSICLKKRIIKWPLRYDYTIKICYASAPAGAGGSQNNIEMWYLIDGSLVWFPKEQQGF